MCMLVLKKIKYVMLLYLALDQICKISTKESAATAYVHLVLEPVFSMLESTLCQQGIWSGM